MTSQHLRTGPFSPLGPRTAEHGILGLGCSLRGRVKDNLFARGDETLVAHGTRLHHNYLNSHWRWQRLKCRWEQALEVKWLWH